ncbi:hypothetical protein BC938DRAFT_473083 [Jimgerdemannia flammicorona]|uniref:Uncharacterized protein n=1 Tax=Jimgerdemannia flammicorona TaxID=994334 RepID=A0A433Q4M9_9FUNG|nr:hypothetical protein BC938DRAFT_473083 [Jimgerdemannia flammicorona]
MVVLQRVLHHARDILAGAVEDEVVATRVVSHEFGDIVDLVVVDNPAGLCGIVLFDVCKGVLSESGCDHVGQMWWGKEQFTAAAEIIFRK